MVWAVELALYTGQRPGGGIAMRWDKLVNGGVVVVQEKGGVHLWIPIHPRLEKVLAGIPKKSLTTLTTPGAVPGAKRVSITPFPERKSGWESARCFMG